jgi:hypothetical protein
MCRANAVWFGNSRDHIDERNSEILWFRWLVYTRHVVQVASVQRSYTAYHVREYRILLAYVRQDMNA